MQRQSPLLERYTLAEMAKPTVSDGYRDKYHRTGTFMKVFERFDP